MKRKFLFLFFFFSFIPFTCQSNSHDSLQIFFHDLKDPLEAQKLSGQKVCILGFLYQKADGKWILAQEPHIKSCCIGNEKRRCEEIVMDIEHVPCDRLQPSFVEGIFRVESQHQVQYFLDKVVFLSEKEHNFLFFWGIFLSGAIVALLIRPLAKLRMSLNSSSFFLG